MELINSCNIEIKAAITIRTDHQALKVPEQCQPRVQNAMGTVKPELKEITWKGRSPSTTWRSVHVWALSWPWSLSFFSVNYGWNGSNRSLEAARGSSMPTIVAKPPVRPPSDFQTNCLRRIKACTLLYSEYLEHCPQVNKAPSIAKQP